MVTEGMFLDTKKLKTNTRCEEFNFRYVTLEIEAFSKQVLDQYDHLIKIHG
jgi:hypothetical protein